MKVVIIGGGIAGLTLARLMLQRNIEVVVCERTIGATLLGHAFLMHTDGLDILKEMQGNTDVKIPGESVDSFTLRRPDNKEIKRMQLNSWRCMKRTDLIKFLGALVPKENIKEGRAFSHFIYDNDTIVAAAFLNGEVEYGDIFVGADGSNSKVRELIHGKVKFTPVEVKEVVGVARNPELAKQYIHKFTKFQKKESGLSFGMIPTGYDEFVWFMQYDPAISDVPDASPEELKEFCFRVLGKFPPVVHELLSGNDFSTTYPWNTRDFDLLPTFHRKNVVLIGDAAHVALPFTSAGTTNAILDAKVVMQCLEQCINYDDAFQKYYDERAEGVYNHISLGRELKKIFLNPPKDDDHIPVPLIAVETNTETLRKNKPIQVQYFTDPICSTAWMIQPFLRKLTLEYDEHINIEYRMGGLLPSWQGYDKGGISQPSDAAEHWEQVCAINEMPLDGDIWNEDPLSSSFPPSIAFKAAQIQSTEKAILFLRRIKEMVFLEKKNIINWNFLEDSAFEVGLDSARLLKDIGGKAKVLFSKDLELVKKLNVTIFPTLFFSDKNGNSYTIEGYHSYKKFEEVVRNLMPNIEKAKVNTDPKFLFSKFNRMSEFEFAFLSNINREEAKEVLTSLFNKGLLDKYESKNGNMWISNFK